ncbi:hypothetical protein TWF696_008997 [Orbilia brochopaga]|uniref:Uncharacterized protein n=1 Tax=Orbilia brochopaga TaxID=3140254 RepID=A0AAV9UHG3_9PEZI
MLFFHRCRLIASALLTIFLCATCQAAPYNSVWLTYPPSTTAFTPPASCSSTTFWRYTSRSQEIGRMIYYKQCSENNKACCPMEYRQSLPKDTQRFLALGLCPDGFDSAEYWYSGSGGKIVTYCCPRSMTVSTFLPNDILCVSTDSTVTMSELTSSVLHLVVATPIFVIAKEGVEAREAASAPTSVSRELVRRTDGAIPNRESHDVGLKIGISLAVIVPVIAVLAFLCRVFIIVPRQRLEYDESGAVELSSSSHGRTPPTTRRNRCDDGDSIADPPPPYIANEHEAPPPGIDTPVAGISRETDAPTQTPNITQQSRDGRHERPVEIHPPVPDSDPSLRI